MSAVGGIRAELALLRERRDVAAKALDKSHKTYMAARVVFERDQGHVEWVNDRIQTLHDALSMLGAADVENTKEGRVEGNE